MARTWEISRRTFLRGAGVAMALPALEAMTPWMRRAGAAGSPQRLFVFYVPNGIDMANWTPAASGAAYDLPPILAPLASVKDDVLVLTGLVNHPAEDTIQGDHARGTASFLTCAQVTRTEGSDIHNGVSMDQVLAQAIGSTTVFPSLQLGGEGGSGIGDCDSGYSCAYARNISWAGPTTPLAKETNPQSLFDRLFQGQAGSAASRARTLARRQSVLDAVRADATRLAGQLGRTDNAKLDEYLTGVRELELRIETLANAPTCEAERPELVTAFPDRLRALLDLTVLAFQCDLTRVVTLMVANAASNIAYPFLGITDGHHQVSHHQGNPDNLTKIRAIDTWEVEQFAYLVGRLKAVSDATGPLLDSSAVLFSSEIEDGDWHRHTNLPVVLAGRAGGALAPGRHVVYADAPPIANLYVSLLNALGAPTSTFGDDGTGPLPALS